MTTEPRWLRMQRLACRERERYPQRYVLGVNAGICGNQGLSLYRPGLDGLVPTFCNLMAGHIGAHSDGEGHWSKTNEGDQA